MYQKQMKKIGGNKFELLDKWRNIIMGRANIASLVTLPLPPHRTPFFERGRPSCPILDNQYKSNNVQGPCMLSGSGEGKQTCDTLALCWSINIASDGDGDGDKALFSEGLVNCSPGSAKALGSGESGMSLILPLQKAYCTLRMSASHLRTIKSACFQFRQSVFLT